MEQIQNQMTSLRMDDATNNAGVRPRRETRFVANSPSHSRLKKSGTLTSGSNNKQSMMRRGQVGKRVKQISNESNSSFFTSATVTSTVVGNEDEFVVANNIADVLYEHSEETSSSGSGRETQQQQQQQQQHDNCSSSDSGSYTTSDRSQRDDIRSKTENENKVLTTPTMTFINEQPPHMARSQDPVQIVYDFLALVSLGRYQDAARQFLDESVTVSIPGRPFCVSSAVWVQHERLYGSVDKSHVWHILERGAHNYQVVRRGQEKKGHRAVVQVFELCPDSADPRIVAMYLRSAPRQWSLGRVLRGGKKQQPKLQPNLQLASRSSQRIQRLLDAQESRELRKEKKLCEESSDEDW